MNPTYELRNVKIIRELSDETTCFTATLYRQGVRIGTAQNRGEGGPTDVLLGGDPETFNLGAERAALERAARAWCAEERLVSSEPVESFVDHLLEVHGDRKTARRWARKGFPVTGVIRVGVDPLTAEQYLCSGRARADVEDRAAKLQGTVVRWYEEAT